MLWHRSLVMEDMATGSLWSHHLGRAMRGELLGTELPIVVSEITSWADWLERFPQTTVLALRRTARDFETQALSDGEGFVYGMVEAGEAWATSLEIVEQAGHLEMVLGGHPFLIVSDPKTHAVRAFSRQLAGEKRVLSFPAGEELRDRETNSLWDSASGKAIDGELAGSSLEKAVGILSFLTAWKAFHPDSSYAEALPVSAP